MTLTNSRDGESRLYVSGAPPVALPETGRGGQDRPPWYETPYGAWRLSAEREAMRRFPGFTLLGLDVGAAYWTGWLRSSLHADRWFFVKVAYPEAFPDYPPDVSIEWPTLPDGVPHLLTPGRPCLYMPSQGHRAGYEPGRTTAATLVAWTALWINAFHAWQATGRWPGRSH